MENTFNFDAGELNIDKKAADEFREAILAVARENNIADNPIQYELLLKHIKAKMTELSTSVKFTFSGTEVDFSKDNPVIFTTRVLKSFFLEKKDAGIITMQSKNLDILSFYAYGIPFSKSINSNGTNGNHKGRNHLLIKSNNKRNWLLPSILAVLLLLLSVTLFIMWKFLDSERKHFSADISEYQSVIKKLYNTEFFESRKFNPKYYDTLQIPPSSLLLSLGFSSIEESFNHTKFYTTDGITLQQIFEKDTFGVLPGVKYCETFKEPAFGFGKTKRESDCYTRNISYDKQKYMCILRLKFRDSTYVSYITFNWAEIGYNWGSTGHVHINGESDFIGVDPYQTIGIFPASNKILDENKYTYKCMVGRNVSFIDIAIWDITDESEIFINDLMIFGK